MNKAKVMLSALGICAVLATTFAFTAQKFTNKIIYTGTSSTNCTVPVNGRVVTDSGTELIFASTAVNTLNCPQTFTLKVIGAANQ